MFPNRLSVVNPGGLFGPVTLELLGREGISSTRNATLLRLLEDINPVGGGRAICENRGSGVGAMFAALQQAGLPEPDFNDPTRKWLTILRDEGKIEITTLQMRSKNARYRAVKKGKTAPSRTSLRKKAK